MNKRLRTLLFAVGFFFGYQAIFSCGPTFAFAQAPAAAPAPAAAAPAAQAVKLSVAQIVALGAVNEKMQQNQDVITKAQQDRQGIENVLHSLENEIATEHPGYHFDEASGQIVKNPPAIARPAPAPAPAAPAPAKK